MQHTSAAIKREIKGLEAPSASQLLGKMFNAYSAEYLQGLHAYCFTSLMQASLMQATLSSKYVPGTYRHRLWGKVRL